MKPIEQSPLAMTDCNESDLYKYSSEESNQVQSSQSSVKKGVSNRIQSASGKNRQEYYNRYDIDESV